MTEIGSKRSPSSDGNCSLLSNLTYAVSYDGVHFPNICIILLVPTFHYIQLQWVTLFRLRWTLRISFCGKKLWFSHNFCTMNTSNPGWPKIWDISARRRLSWTRSIPMRGPQSSTRPSGSWASWPTASPRISTSSERSSRILVSEDSFVVYAEPAKRTTGQPP